MRRPRLRCAGVTCAALLGAAARLAAQDAPADQILRAEAAASAASASLGFAAALVPRFDSGVTYLHPGAPVVRGLAAARALLESATELNDVVVTWTPGVIHVAADTTLAASQGVAVLTPRRSGAPRLGGYIIVWRNGAAGWKIEALVFSGVLPPLGGAPPAAGRTAVAAGARPFATADSTFAALAGRAGAAEAFFRWAASDAVTFGREGRLTRGPEAIRLALSGNTASWRWAPVAGAASRSGDLGWTVGESAITPADGATSYGKYLTVWRRDAEGPRFIADAGNTRPAPGP